MATIIRATCQFGCGDIKLDSSNVTLRLRKGFEDGDGEYRFRCPQCNAICLKPASTNIVTLLKSANVDVEVWELPLELLERPNATDAKPISHDDVIDLGLELENDEEGWFNRMKNRKRDG